MKKECNQFDAYPLASNFLEILLILPNSYAKSIKFNGWLGLGFSVADVLLAKCISADTFWNFSTSSREVTCAQNLMYDYITEEGIQWQMLWLMHLNGCFCNFSAINKYFHQEMQRVHLPLCVITSHVRMIMKATSYKTQSI